MTGAATPAQSSPTAALIEARDFSVTFSASGLAALKGVNLTIHAGETLALVGHTGSGKSSIGKLIARFYEFQGGRISVDGHDLRTVDLADYRSRLGIVTQTPFLFDGTVADNIRYANAEISDREIEDIARQIGGGAHHWFWSGGIEPHGQQPGRARRERNSRRSGSS